MSSKRTQKPSKGIPEHLLEPTPDEVLAAPQDIPAPEWDSAGLEEIAGMTLYRVPGSSPVIYYLRVNGEVEELPHSRLGFAFTRAYTHVRDEIHRKCFRRQRD